MCREPPLPNLCREGMLRNRKTSFKRSRRINEGVEIGKEGVRENERMSSLWATFARPPNAHRLFKLMTLLGSLMSRVLFISNIPSLFPDHCPRPSLSLIYGLRVTRVGMRRCSQSLRVNVGSNYFPAQSPLITVTVALAGSQEGSLEWGPVAPSLPHVPGPCLPWEVIA